MTARELSPCVGICRLDDNNMCVGCLRYMDEIRVWGLLTEDAQRKILAEITRRQSGLPIAHPKDSLS